MKKLPSAEHDIVTLYDAMLNLTAKIAVYETAVVDEALAWFVASCTSENLPAECIGMTALVKAVRADLDSDQMSVDEIYRELTNPEPNKAQDMVGGDVPKHLTER